MNTNSAMKSYNNVYVNTGVQEASSHRLISMLFDGLLARIAQAKGAMQQKDFENKGRKVSESINIIMGLRDFLDLEKGGEVAANLDALYDYVQRTLMQGHIQNDQSKLDECRDLLTEVSSAWAEIS